MSFLIVILVILRLCPINKIIFSVIGRYVPIILYFDCQSRSHYFII